MRRERASCAGRGGLGLPIVVPALLLALAGLPAGLFAGSAAPTPASQETPASQAGAAPAAGEDGPQLPPFAEAREPDIAPAQRLRAARVLTRTVLADLRLVGDPDASDYRLAALMLRDVSRLVPSDAQAARRWLEAAHAAGDDAMVLEATRAVIRADPKDTVAQLRLITARLNAMQIAKERLGAYEQLLSGSGSGAIDASVRSRLALDAALLARDMGDEAKFVSLLKDAAKLDSTNKDAAFLAYVYFSQRVADDLGRLELLSNLLMADPLDASSHIQMRDLLASNGAWEGAHRFHQIALRILDARQQSDLSTRVQTLALQMSRSTPAAALASVTGDLLQARDQQRRAFEQSKRQTQELSALAPEDVRLALPLETMRVAAAHAADDRGALASAITDMSLTTSQSLAMIQDSTRRPEGMDEAQVKESSIALVYELSMWRLLTQTEAAFAKNVSGTVKEQMEADDARAKVFDAWIALRGDNATIALELCQQLLDAGQEDIWSETCRALALEAKGKTSDAAALLRAIGGAEPLTPNGSWAWWKANQIEARGASELAQAMMRYTRTVPQWVDLMIANPDNFQRITVQQPSVAGGTADLLAGAPVIISIRNQASIPLGLGDDRTINSRLLLGPRIDTPRQFPRELADAEVLDAGQRLRLNPNEELRVSFWPSESPMGWVLDTLSDQTSRVRYRLLQGFIITDEGLRVAPMGNLDIDAPALSYAPLEESRMEVTPLAQRVLQAGDARVPGLLVASRALLTRPTAQVDPDLPRIAQAWAVRTPGLPPLLRALVMCEMPTFSEAEMTTLLDLVGSRDPDPLAQRWYIFARGTNSDSPTVKAAFEQALASPDATVAEVARLQKARLDAGKPTISQRGILALGVSAGGDGQAAPGATPR